jgi:lysophospholipase
MRRMRSTRTLVKALRLMGLGRLYVPGRDASVLQSRPFAGNPLTSDPVRYARNAAVLEAEPSLATGWPTVAWADAAFRAMTESLQPSYPARIRQPLLVIAAGLDAIVSTGAIENFPSGCARVAPIVPGRAMSLMDGSFRSQALAAFDAFVPGAVIRLIATRPFQHIERQRTRSSPQRQCGRRTRRFFHVVITRWRQ